MREFLNSLQKIEFDKAKKYIQRYAISDLGREHFENLTPSADFEKIQNDLNLVSEVKSLLEGDDPLPFDHLFDIRTSLHRSTIDNYILPPEDLLKINLALKTSKSVLIYFNRRTGKYPLLYSIVKSINIEKILEYNIERAIDEEGRVRDNASKELRDIRNKIVEKNSQLKRSLEIILKTVVGKEWAQEDIITTREGRMVIPVKVEHKAKVPGFIHSVSSSGATVYIEPSETLENNNDIRSLYIDEQREVNKILKDLTDQVRSARESILNNLFVLAELDFLQAKARYSIETLGSQPIVKKSGPLVLRNAYHPILLNHHGQKGVTPLNVEILNGIRTIVITGPNAGGKSVTMKTIGLLSALVQSGCHVPVSSDSEFTVFTDLFVDLGDEQSIENDLSSFSSHLSNLKVILENANATSLVLIDEIGSGTDPGEGASLAASILEKLTHIGSLNIATTHHGALKAFAFETDKAENAAMEFDQNTLQPTYRFKLGIPGSSYAFEMARRLSIPSDIIERSREFNGSESIKLERLIIDLEKQSQELKDKLDDIRKEKSTLDTLNSDYKKRVTALEKEIKEIKLQALNEARFIVSKANAIIEKSVKEIREKSGERSIIKRAKEEIRQASDNFREMMEEITILDENADFKIGDAVQIKDSGTRGEIVSFIDDNQCIIVISDKKVKVCKNDLKLMTEKREQPDKSHHKTHEVSPGAAREIDLRGMYGEEAITAIDKFIDNAILAGLNRIDIIHGKGTGALRKKITDYLNKHLSIKSFRLGEWNEGGTGVTVVELK